jgi:hypothetical protein
MQQIVTGLQSYFALGMLPSTRISVARAAVGKLKVGLAESSSLQQAEIFYLLAWNFQRHVFDSSLLIGCEKAVPDDTPWRLPSTKAQAQQSIASHRDAWSPEAGLAAAGRMRVTVMLFACRGCSEKAVVRTLIERQKAQAQTLTVKMARLKRLDRGARHCSRPAMRTKI